MQQLYLRSEQMGHVITETRPLPGFRLWLRFETGEDRVLDVAPFIEEGPAFRCLVDENEFKRVAVVAGAVEWSCGASIDPDVAFWRAYPDPESE